MPSNSSIPALLKLLQADLDAIKTSQNAAVIEAAFIDYQDILSTYAKTYGEEKQESILFRQQVLHMLHAYMQHVINKKMNKAENEIMYFVHAYPAPMTNVKVDLYLTMAALGIIAVTLAPVMLAVFFAVPDLLLFLIASIFTPFLFCNFPTWKAHIQDADRCAFDKHTCAESIQAVTRTMQTRGAFFYCAEAGTLVVGQPIVVGYQPKVATH